jgi:hypothetical protein
MGKSGNNKSIYFTLVSFFVLLAPAFYFTYWIYCFSVYTNRNDAVANFESAMPNFMRAGGYFTFVVLAIVALLLGAQGISNRNSFWQNISLLITLVSGLLAFLYLLLMMLKFIA